MKSETEKQLLETYGQHKKVGNKIIIRRPNGTLRVITHLQKEDEKTNQSFKTECDINQIIKKYKTTGQITHLNSKTGRYMDVTNAPDLKEALQTAIHAADAFNSLPATLRKRFSNDPQEFLQFLDDPKNADEAVQLGLLRKTEQQNDKLNDEKLTQNAKAPKTKTPPPPPPDDQAD